VLLTNARIADRVARMSQSWNWSRDGDDDWEPDWREVPGQLLDADGRPLYDEMERPVIASLPPGVYRCQVVPESGGADEDGCLDVMPEHIVVRHVSFEEIRRARLGVRVVWCSRRPSRRVAVGRSTRTSRRRRRAASRAGPDRLGDEPARTVLHGRAA
jgi:hypothetical protein